MKRFLLIICTSYWFPLNLFAQTSGKPKTYAIIVGISSYQSKSLPLLKYADKDAGLFAAYLQSKAGGNVPAVQIKLLVNQNATIAGIYNAFDWLKERSQKDDIVYFYFSGHGDIETKIKHRTGYLLAYNTPPNNYANNAISIENLNKEANALTLTNKAKVILITDACHSGKLAGDFFKGKQFVSNQLALVLNNEVRLASCLANQEAAEGVEWGGGRGVFSYYLLNGLNGFADHEADGSIQLGEIAHYLDSCFAHDQYLRENHHQQNPVVDGNNNFVLGFTNDKTFNALKAAQTANNSSGLPAGLQSFTAQGRQPLDYFFEQLKDEPLESIFPFKAYVLDSAKNIPQKIVHDWILYAEKMRKTIDPSGPVNDEKQIKYLRTSLDTLQLLQVQLQNSQALISRFNAQLVTLIQDKCQDMINAYITGDLAELERRQYYYAGNRQYDDVLPMIGLALKLVPKSDYLAQVLAVDNFYISGLIARLNMATHSNTDSLLRQAFDQQQKALKLEPYAAYIHNELGNLYLRQQKPDSANYHFSLASVLAPSWAIPWANKIRLYLSENNLPKALTAVHKSDSLQPGLSFSMMNAGLVMEKTGNLLAAETRYKKAINANKVHFLPYERLGNIYMNTGRYDDADYYLSEAQNRKKGFSITDNYFKYGVELGGFRLADNENKVDTCVLYGKSKDPKVLSYIQFAQTLVNLSLEKISSQQALQNIKAILQQTPEMPFANHYLGKILFLNSEWKAARIVLIKAVGDYQTQKAGTLTGKIYADKNSIADSCLVNTLTSLRYDELEDHYLLGEVYEKQKNWPSAVSEYTFISKQENLLQNKQSVYYDFEKNSPGNNDIEGLIAQFESPVKMGGALKLAGLYEQLKQYRRAEIVWLGQVAQNRSAGFARRQAIARKTPGLWQLTADINFYWLNINRGFEIGIHNFYNRMMRLYPRDYYWKERAGLFLYNRLALAFNQMPVEQFKSFSASINDFKYPWTTDELSAAPDTLVTVLPGTGEHITLVNPVFEPVKEALDNLLESVELSPATEPKLEVAQAIADLNAWLGQSDDATKAYLAVMKRIPQNADLRNKVIDYFSETDDLYGAYEQMNILYRQKKLKREQVLMLAEDRMLVGKKLEARSLMKNYVPKNSTEKYQTQLLNAKIDWLSGDLGKALVDFKYKVPVIAVKPNDTDSLKQVKAQQNCYRTYTIAKLYALTHKTVEAFSTLKNALNLGFNCKYVLDNDVAWKAVRNDPKWVELLKQYTFNKYTSGITVEQVNPISYRIPNLSYK